jgi:hypothetical protein
MLHLILFKSLLPIFSQSHKISLPLSLPLKQRGFSTSFSQSPFFTFTLTAIWAPHAPTTTDCRTLRPQAPCRPRAGELRVSHAWASSTRRPRAALLPVSTSSALLCIRTEWAPAGKLLVDPDGCTHAGRALRVLGVEEIREDRRRCEILLSDFHVGPMCASRYERDGVICCSKNPLSPLLLFSQSPILIF